MPLEKSAQAEVTSLVFDPGSCAAIQEYSSGQQSPREIFL
jgi:hypothetical protein